MEKRLNMHPHKLHATSQPDIDVHADEIADVSVDRHDANVDVDVDVNVRVHVKANSMHPSQWVCDARSWRCNLNMDTPIELNGLVSLGFHCFLQLSSAGLLVVLGSWVLLGLFCLLRVKQAC